MHYRYNVTIGYMQTVSKLIDQFKPTKYNIFIDIDRLNRKFIGSTTIVGESFSSDNSIRLHSKDLSIEKIVIDGKIAAFEFGINDELIISHPDLKPDKHIIVIAYSGVINDSMHGMYPCYFEHNGIKKELIATQFESHHAREVIPCIDEPAAKASYDLTLSTEKNLVVLGNMPIKSQSVENNKLITTFQTTPIMSSYLLAWVAGELHKKSIITKSGVEVNVWTTPAQSSQSLDFALDIAARSLEFFNEYFDTPYPLPKIDHVALPDFSSGAMENWGLITYREIALLAEKDKTSINSKRYIATVIAHELSHQWFGNLVTMEWWDDLWLNESFASLIEYVAVDAIEPTWNIWLDFASFDSISALKRDSLDGVQPVKIDVNHPDEISTLFDGAIVYAKGARLMQMLRHYIGEDNFKKGLKNYFKKYAYKNTTAEDLWQSFEEVCQKNIALFMNQWLIQPGFPVVNITQQDKTVYLTQNRLSNVFSKTNKDTLWPIALNANNQKLPTIFSTKDLKINNVRGKIKLNQNNISHFITNYDDNLLQKFINDLAQDKLSAIERLQLLNEQNILASAGIINNAKLIDLIKNYSNEKSEPVWDIISFSIGELKKFVTNDEDADSNLRTLVGNIALNQYKRLGWDKNDNEDDSDTSLRSTILSLMLYSENLSVISTAIKKFKSKSIKNLNPELRSIIISAEVIYENDLNTINSLLDEYKNTESPEIKQSICSGLTSTRNQEVIDLLIRSLKDNSLIRSQDLIRWVVNLLRNKYAQQKIWDWIIENWPWITETFSGDKSYDDYPRYTANFLVNDKQLREYKMLFSPLLKDPSLKRAIKMGIIEISNRIKLIKRDRKSVIEKLSNL